MFDAMQGKMKPCEVVRMGYDLLHKHSLFDWTFVLDNSVTRAGLCNSARKCISVSKHLSSDMITEVAVRNIILHEIAHALVGSFHQHDHVWKQKAMEIGCDGKRCHNIVLSPAKYIIRCSCGQTMHYRHRLTKRTFNAIPSCNTCMHLITMRL